MDAVAVANNDVTALDVLYSVGDQTVTPTPMTTPRWVTSADSTASRILEMQCDEFDALLRRHASDEERIHQWMARKEHHHFLDTDCIQVWSKMRFGNYVSDFVVQRSDETYKLIEIEPPSYQVLNRSNADPSARFNHACQQVFDWQRYVRDHVHHVRDVQGLPGIYEPSGMVLIGRDTELRTSMARSRWQDIKARHNLEIATYDDVVRRIRALAKRLRQLEPLP